MMSINFFYCLFSIEISLKRINHLRSLSVKKEKETRRKKKKKTGEVELRCLGSVGHLRQWLMASACFVTGSDTDWEERDCLCITRRFFV